MAICAVQEGYTRRWIHGFKKTLACRPFADHEICVARDLFEGFMVFHRRSAWIITSRVSEERAVEMARGLEAAGIDWDFEDSTEPAGTAARIAVTAWMQREMAA